MKTLIVLFASLTILAGCSGGGGGSDGGSSDGFYAGVWDFEGTRALDDCGLGVPSTLNTRVTVNQDGNYIVANSGTVTLTGAVDASNDGFTVTASDDPGNGCSRAYAYSFKDASDGLAGVGVVVSVSCGGVICNSGYSGPAQRLGTRDESLAVQDISITDIADIMSVR